MAKHTKLTVATEVGTFTRTTVRTYTHLVVAGPTRAEVLEARRQEQMAESRREIAEYGAPGAVINHIAAERARVTRNGMSPAQVDEWMARIAHLHTDETFAGYAADAAATLARLEQEGPVTVDRDAPGVLGWCGRLDLAMKLAATEQANPYRWVRVVDVTTGETVRTFAHGEQTADTVLALREARRTARRRVRRTWGRR